MIHIVRILFLVVVLALTISYTYSQDIYEKGSTFVTLYILIPSGVALLVVLVDMFWRRKRLQLLSGLFFGLLAGVIIAFVLALVVDLMVAIFPGPPEVERPAEVEPPPPVPGAASQEQYAAYKEAMDAYTEAKRQYEQTLSMHMDYLAHVRTVQLMKLLIGAAMVFACVSFVLQTKDDFRFVIPYVEFAKETKGARPVLLDTSAIIDGRIADIVETGVIESEMIVPRFILAELQGIADSEDKLKRNRGRRGLDILNRLQTSEKADIKIVDPHVPRVEQAGDVDAKLVALAQDLSGRIVTNDYNLNKVARLRGVDVVNINDLSNALKPIVLPGEGLTVKIIRPGEEPGQGVGYLEDGTMVVVEQGRDFISREVVITVTSVLQTSAGRMIFGRLNADKSFTHRRDDRNDKRQ